MQSYLEKVRIRGGEKHDDKLCCYDAAVTCHDKIGGMEKGLKGLNFASETQVVNGPAKRERGNEEIFEHQEKRCLHYSVSVW